MNGNEREAPGEVAPIELFFDLVFVYVITQFAHLVEDAHGPQGVALALLVMVPVWWIYSGYSWLTNNAGESTPLRLILVGAMGGFLVMATAVPDVLRTGGLVFGLAYLFIVVLHLTGFLLHGRHGARRAILAIAPVNLAAAALLIATAFAEGVWKWPLLGITSLIFAVQIIIQITHRERRFALNAAHFAERHRLIVIIALGESIIAIAVGAAGHFAEIAGLARLVLALMLVAALWWSYFDREDQRAEDHFLEAPPEERNRMALLGYWCGHLAIVFGIVLVAAGIRKLLGGEHEGIPGPLLLGAGLALFMAGDLLFRWVMTVRPLLTRATCGLLAPLLGFAGLEWTPVVFLAAVTLLPVTIVAVESVLERR